jgi:hypothetical protein
VPTFAMRYPVHISEKTDEAAAVVIATINDWL